LIADIAIYPWIAAYEFMGLSLDEYSNLQRWYELLKQRPAVEKEMNVPN
jgi:GST-like protein